MTSGPAGPAVALVVGVLVLAAASAATAGRRLDQATWVRARLWGRRRPGAPRWFAAVAVRAELSDPDRLWPWARRSAVAIGLIVVLVAPAVAGGALVVLAIARALHPRLDRTRSAAACDAALPEAIDAMTASMASGASLAQAVMSTAERPDVVGRDLALVSAQHRQGTVLQHAVDDWARRRPGTGVGLVADALALAGASGGSQVRALLGVGDTLREREALAREVRALGSQAQMSAAVLVATPLAFAAVVAVLDRRIAAFLLATPAGWACLGTGLLLDLAGGWWMRALVRGIR